ncbi:MAG: HAMP domain-containing sensor histidine kinase [Pseudomonadota bacterium]
MRLRLPKGLSGRLLILTMVVIMLTEIFVFVPSVANFRLSWLSDHFVTGEATAIALENLGPDAMSDAVRNDLLSLTRTQMIVVRNGGTSRILATREMPGQIAKSVEIAQPGRAQAVASIADAFDTLINGGDRVIRVYGPMQRRPGTLELVMRDEALRSAMLAYAYNVLLISLAISVLTGMVVFLTLRQLMIRPLQKLTGVMAAFSKEPEVADHIIEPSGRADEIGVAESQMSAMQKQVSGTLSQRRRLADLGLAVSKINHDMRNILASASLFSERISALPDPTAKRLAPRLVRTIDRAVDYSSAVLAYGKAGEAEPKRTLIRLHQLVGEVAEALALDGDTLEGPQAVDFINKVDPALEVQADGEQLFRVLVNLARNAVQAMEQVEGEAVVRRLTVEAHNDDGKTHIALTDTGPGLPEEMRERLFTAFQTSGRAGGTGLGLAIAAELIRAHGGTIKLAQREGPGARFEICLPN